MIRLVAVVIILLFCPFSYAGTYWVDDNGAVTVYANCESPTPLSGASACTWETATDNAVAGDIINFRGGTYSLGQEVTDICWTYEAATSIYDRCPIMQPTNEGTNLNKITFRAYNGETVTIQHGAGARDGILIGSYKRNGIVWDGFTVVGTDSKHTYYGVVTFYGSTVANGPAYCEAKNLTITTETPTVGDIYTGIFLQHAHDAVIEFNSITSAGIGIDANHAGIMIYRSNDYTVQNNEISNYGIGIYPKANSCPQEGSGFCETFTIRRNIISDCEAGIKLNNHRSGEVYQNIIYNGKTHAGGSPETGFYLRNGAVDVDVYNNVVYSVDHGLVEDYNDTLNSLNDFRNNIFHTGANYAVDNRDTEHDQMTLDYNCYYNYSMDDSDMMRHESVNYSLATWVTHFTAEGYDANSINSNPQFVNVAVIPEGFKLQSGSPAESAGTTFGDITTSTPNMGAYVTGSELLGISAGLTIKTFGAGGTFGHN